VSGGSPGDRRVCLGAITGAHGIRGEVRIHCFASDPASLTAFGPLGDETGRRTFVVEGLRDANKGYIARIRGVTDRNAAEALRGTQLFIERDALPEPEEEDSYYLDDLVGLKARDPAGQELGDVIAVHDFGAGDVIEVQRPQGRQTFMVPFAESFVPALDVDAGFIVIDAPADWIEAAPEKVRRDDGNDDGDNDGA